MFSGHGLVVIVDEKPVVPLSAWFVGVHEVLLEAGNDLLKGLLIDTATCSVGIEVNLVDALSEKPGIAPVRDTVSDLAHK